MLANLSFLLLLIALLTAPGVCALQITSKLFKPAKTTKHLHKAAFPLITFSISYAVFIFSLLIFRLAGGNVDLFTYWVALYLLASCITIIWLTPKKLIQDNTTRSKLSKLLFTSPIFWLSSATLIYQIGVGVYSEIPADIYQHLGLFQIALGLQENNSLGRTLGLAELLQQKSWAWYHFIALITRISPIPIDNLLFISTWTTKTLFLLAVYYLSLILFAQPSIGQSTQDSKPSTQHGSLIAIAVVACCFTTLHFGVNVFSFVQYYSFAPAILAQVIYFSCIPLFMLFFKAPSQQSSFIALLLAGALTLAVNTVHQQEAMFIMIIFSLMLLISNLPAYTKSKTRNEKMILRGMLILLGTAAIAVYIFAHLNLPRSSNIGWKLWEFGSGFGLIPDISTLNMKYQGIRVITLWGLLVYGLFFLNLKRYKHNLFILAGMLSPLFTVLNPFFTDLFLRFDHSSTLFRLCYLIPLHFVAADIFIHYLNQLRLKKTNSIATQFYYCACIALLIALLLPIKNTWQGFHYSRFPTLLSIDNNNSHRHLSDLTEFLSSIEERKKVLTDPTTGYVISALTKHHSWRGKFRENRSYKKFTFDDYQNDPLAQYKGYLLVINKRTKQFSETGKLSRHWDQFQLKSIARYYPDNLIEHVEQTPQRFDKLWQDNAISVYLVK